MQGEEQAEDKKTFFLSFRICASLDRMLFLIIEKKTNLSGLVCENVQGP